MHKQTLMVRPVSEWSKKGRLTLVIEKDIKKKQSLGYVIATEQDLKSISYIKGK